MEIKVRKPNLENLTKDGIPKDSADVMEYFNSALKENSLPFIPRKVPITLKEIREKWVPSFEKNITLLAELNGKIVGSMTVFYGDNSTEYEHVGEITPGRLNSTADPRYGYKEIVEKLIEGMELELKTQNKKALCNVPIESPTREVFEKLGYVGKPIELERYKKSGLSGKAMQYNLPYF